GHVLLHRADQDNFWSLPGGRGELLEPSTETICREFREELGCDVRVERLLWIVENFFTYDASKFHEIAFYYKIEILNRIDLLDKAAIRRGIEDLGTGLTSQWFTLQRIRDLRLYP